MANGISNFLTNKIFPAATPDNQTANGNLKTLLFSPTTTRGEANAAFNHITGQVGARQTSASDPPSLKEQATKHKKKSLIFIKKFSSNSRLMPRTLLRGK